jgi:hypothetical protein
MRLRAILSDESGVKLLVGTSLLDTTGDEGADRALSESQIISSKKVLSITGKSIVSVLKK